MKVGDMVGSPYHAIRGIVVKVESDGGNNRIYNSGPAVRIKWFDGDDSIEWAETLRVISTTLSDEQLENVRGGMSQQRFSDWRAEKLNEGG